MIKRLTWFAGGAVAGVAGAGYAKRKVKETASQLAPANVARVAVAKVRERTHDVVDAVRDGREAMHAKEAELRARIDNSPTTQADAVEPGDVIVLRQRSDDHTGPRRASRRARRSA